MVLHFFYRAETLLSLHRSDEFWVMSDELHTLLGLFTHIHIPGLLTGLSFFSALLFLTRCDDPLGLRSVKLITHCLHLDVQALTSPADALADTGSLITSVVVFRVFW